MLLRQTCHSLQYQCQRGLQQHLPRSCKQEAVHYAAVQSPPSVAQQAQCQNALGAS